MTKKLVSLAAGLGLLANTALPVFATTTISISENGVGSDNFVTLNQTTTTTVTQSNNANVTNHVDADADTGGNSAQFNTGGTTAIGTGNATTAVTVSNDLNRNAASVACCDTGATEVLVKENGAFSDNTVTLGKVNAVVVDQDNYAYVKNYVNSDADTGDNKASLNTGGDTIIATGDAKATVDVSTKANYNSAMVGGGAGSSVVPSASFKIIGNGAFSDNFITAGLTKTTVIDQDNNADIYNKVDADADSGDNEAKFNTGGDVIIGTGKAEVVAGIDNEVNFNHASIDCGCTWGVTAEIKENGAEYPLDYYFGDNHEWLLPYPFLESGDNVITLGLTSAQVYGQGNLSDLDNYAKYLDADTGYNDASLNTGDSESDPLVSTGDAKSTVNIENAGNVNTIGGGTPWTWPWPEADVEVSFNLEALLAFLGISIS